MPDAIPAASGSYMIPIAKLADMLSAATAVQARFGTTGSAANTLAKINYAVLEDQDIRPLLPTIVLTMQSLVIKQEAGGAMNYLRIANDGSGITMLLADNTRLDNLPASSRDFGNWVGDTIDALKAVAGQSAQLSINSIVQQMPIAICSKEQERSKGLYFLWAATVGFN